MPPSRVTTTVLRLVLALAASSAGCYATTPHRAEVAAYTTKPACLAAIGDVFTRAGFVQGQTPEGYTMLFTARTAGAPWPRTPPSTGVGVLVRGDDPGAEAAGGCRVVLEALSIDSA